LRWLPVTGLLLSGLVLAACATPAPGADPPASGGPASTTSGSTGGVAAVTPIKATRTGGFAGVRQTLVVSVDGNWIYTDGKTNQTQSGKLTSDQLKSVVTLLSDPAVATQLAPRPTGTLRCADAFLYTIQFGGSDTFSMSDCGDLPPAASAILTALSDATPF
jgi:hypothetical protein